MDVINLQRGSFESGKIAVMRGNLLSFDQKKSFENLSFEEILKFLEEHGFQDVIDSNYLSKTGFYLIESILNSYLSNKFSQVLQISNTSLKKFLDVYYLKYQIHNLMATLRCQKSKEENLSSYLIGDSRRKEKYVKAFSMSEKDALVYMSKKLGFDEEEVLQVYEKGFFELENYLYSKYYFKLSQVKLKFNGIDEKLFVNFVSRQVDLLNSRVYLKVISNEGEKLNFDDLFALGGQITKESFDSLKGKSKKDVLKFLSDFFGCDFHDFTDVDKEYRAHKSNGSEFFSRVKFGSPFFTLKYFFELESEISYLRILLKAKYLKISKDELTALLGGEN